jgi:hypothetical protein
MTHFTAFKRQPKFVDTLGAIRQKKDDPLRDYIKRFNDKPIHIKGVNDKMKIYLLCQGMQKGSKFVDLKNSTMGQWIKGMHNDHLPKRNQKETKWQ